MTKEKNDEQEREKALYALRRSLEKFAVSSSVPEEWKEEFLGPDFLFRNAAAPTINSEEKR